MEDDAPRPESGSVEPQSDPAEKLRLLEEEMQRLKRQIEGSGASAPSQGEAPPPQEPQMQEPEPERESTPEEIAQADDLVRRAVVAKRRGLKEEASELFAQAHKIAPTAPAVLESIGDDLAERGQTKPAIDAYARAMKAAPGNVALERKHAELVLRLAGIGSIDEQLRSGLGGDMGGPDSVASGRIAVLLSVIVPGLGQMVTNRIAMGAGTLAAWLAAWIVAVSLHDSQGVRELSKIKSVFLGKGSDVSTWVLLALGAAVIVHFWAIMEAASRVPRERRGPVDRPAPPVDLPFE